MIGRKKRTKRLDFELEFILEAHDLPPKDKRELIQLMQQQRHQLEDGRKWRLVLPDGRRVWL